MNRNYLLGNVKVQSTVVGLVSFFAMVATSGAITVMTVSRLVEANGTSFCTACGPNGEDETTIDGQSIPNSAIGLFDQMAISLGSDAAQDSLISEAGIIGAGSASLGFSTENDSSSNLLTVFTISTDGVYNLSGQVAVNVDGVLDEASVRLSDPSGDLFHRESVSGTEVFDENLALQAGTTYTLDIRLSGQSSGGGGVDGGSWAVNFTAIPEPDTFLLLGSVWLLYSIRSRRRRTR